MSQMSKHHQELTNGIGCCSVPMWMCGYPSGFCDSPAYGEPTQSEKFWNGREWLRTDGKYNGYVPGLACLGHGGPEHPEGVTLQKDGDSWVATGEGFTNLQESPAGFGDTKDEAIRELMEYTKGSSGVPSTTSCAGFVTGTTSETGAKAREVLNEVQNPE